MSGIPNMVQYLPELYMYSFCYITFFVLSAGSSFFVLARPRVFIGFNLLLRDLDRYLVLILIHDLPRVVCIDRVIRVVVAFQQPEGRTDQPDHLIGIRFKIADDRFPV